MQLPGRMSTSCISTGAKPRTGRSLPLPERRTPCAKQPSAAFRRQPGSSTCAPITARIPAWERPTSCPWYPFRAFPWRSAPSWPATWPAGSGGNWELSWCRKGEYEALAAKLASPVLRPDFGPDALTDSIARTGAINVGARPFLIAVNFNLRPDGEAQLPAAKAIARRMRGPGRKAIGWYIPEYGCAQVSMNLTDTKLAPLHEVYERVCREAEAEGCRISGTEIIGLVPRQVLLDAGNGSLEAAISRLHLDDLRPFLPEEKVLEYLLPI